MEKMVLATTAVDVVVVATVQDRVMLVGRQR